MAGMTWTAENASLSPTLRMSDDTQAFGVLSDHQRVILEIVSYVLVSGITCMLGIITNIINIIIFYKQGLDTTTNVSFFALAISDLLSVATLEWTNICLNPLMVNSDLPFHTAEVQYLTTAWPHVCFGHITCWITAYITLERCLCIALPLKIKQIVTPERTTVVICFLYVINMAAFIPEYASVYLDWRFFPERNRSLIGLAFRENREQVAGASHIFLAILGVLSFPAVVLFTIILALKLRQQTEWRMKTTTGNKQNENMTKRDMKTTNMVVLIACVLIACYFPGVVASVATFFLPEFSILGREINLFYALWGFLFWLEAVNSSVNIFVYYNMSTKYKHSFHDLFSRCVKHTGVMEKDAEPED